MRRIAYGWPALAVWMLLGCDPNPGGPTAPPPPPPGTASPAPPPPPSSSDEKGKPKETEETRPLMPLSK